jgi:hypothetical protein
VLDDDAGLGEAGGVAERFGKSHFEHVRHAGRAVADEKRKIATSISATVRGSFFQIERIVAAEVKRRTPGFAKSSKVSIGL